MPEMIKSIPFSEEGAESIPSIICLGNFDGVHLGHAALFRRGCEIKKTMSDLGQKVKLCALCFDSLSSDHLSQAKVYHIMTLEKKLSTFRDMGIDCAYVCNFSLIKDFSPIEFIEHILVNKCSCIGVICGFNFRFGKKAAGDAQFLVDYFEKKADSHSTCCIVPPLTISGKIVSSSYIRELISSGYIEKANSMLGHPFSISHTVVHGKHLGTHLGFPTINHIPNDNELTPAFGIYATKAIIDNEQFISVTNVGTRPTVSKSNIVTCETHIIGIHGEKDLYGKNAEICFFSKIRNEKKFSSPTELTNAIAADVENTKKYFDSIQM